MGGADGISHADSFQPGGPGFFSCAVRTGENPGRSVFFFFVFFFSFFFFFHHFGFGHEVSDHIMFTGIELRPSDIFLPDKPTAGTLGNTPEGGSPKAMDAFFPFVLAIGVSTGLLEPFVRISSHVDMSFFFINDFFSLGKGNADKDTLYHFNVFHGTVPRECFGCDQIGGDDFQAEFPPVS